MKLITLFLLVGFLAVSGWAEDKAIYSPELVKRAELGDANAQCDLGICYFEGTGVPMNEKKAVEWYKKSAEKGNAYAQCLLGVCLSNGNGITKNERESLRWITKSAEQGDAIGQFNLGAVYMQGIGVPKDKKKCVIWWTKAAEQESLVSGEHLVISRLCKRELEKLKSK
jgi:TPR repeat protein